MKKILILFLVIVLSGCLSVNTSDPEKAFAHWAGYKPPKSFEFFNGEFYQSPHFFLEYEVYLKFRTTKEWWNEFIELNNLQIDNDSWSKRTDAPEWFKPYKAYIKYSNNDDFDNSRYFIHKESGICYIYESVGM